MSLIHILDRQSDRIIGTLNLGEYSDSGSNEGKVSSSENENTFDFTALKKFDLLQKRNRLLLQDRDGFFSEYLIIYAEQNSRSRKDIKSNATFTDLQKAKIIEPQTLQGATADTSIDLALAGTEWRKGKVDYNGIRTLKIEEYTNPYSLLKRIASEFGLDLRFRVAVEGNKIVRYVDLTLPDDEFDGKEVVFGKDLVGLRRIEDAQNIVTALLVLGPEQEDGKRLTVLVEDNDALQRWGRNGQHLIEVYEPQITAEDVTVERLRTLGQNALQKRIDAIVTYECQAAILEHIPGKEHEKVRLDRTIRIKDEGYTPPLYLEAKVLEVKEQPSTGKILDFKLGNYKEYSKADLEAQIAGLKKQLNDKLSKLVQVSVTSSAGTVFKNGTGETDLTAVTFLGGKEVDTDGLFYNYVWSKYDKNGNFVGATSGKSITVYARNIDEKETYIVTVENEGAKSIGQITVTNVNDGEQGPPGKSSYTHVAYANSADGRTDFSLTDSNREYIGMYVDDSPTNSTDPTKYKWTLVKGADGAQGIQGPPGADGRTPYLHIAYANSADGRTGFSTTDSANKLYIGQYTDFTPADSTDPAKYSWTLIKGDKGEPGYTPIKGVDYFDGKDGQDGKSSYLWVKYSVNANGNPMTDNPTGALYIGVATTTTPTAPTSYTAYKWSLIKGADGIPGEKGQDGRTSYLHIKYSNDGGKTFTENNGETVGAWMGTYVDFTQADSTNPADYTWNKVKGDQGPQGPQGLQGPPGADGKSLYTWVKYANDINGNGMSDYPDGKKYIGLAYNKTTPTESANPADYTWALIQGPQGVKGTDGQTLYTWIKYADSPTSGMSDDPTGKKYMGIAYNKTTPNESTNYGDYSWSLIQGPKGDQGPQGPQGVQGPKGADGQTLYTWIKYADSPTSGMSDTPTGKKYIGLAYNKTTPTESSNYADYSWSLIQGPQGVQGPKGADGVTTYTWVKYADDDKGAGMSDSPNGKRYLGLAYNKTTPTESTNPADYSWSPLYDNVKVGGRNLLRNTDFNNGTNFWSGIGDIATDPIYGNVAHKSVSNSQITITQTIPASKVPHGEYTYSVILKSTDLTKITGAGFVIYYVEGGYTDYTWTSYTTIDLGNGFTKLTKTGKTDTSKTISMVDVRVWAQPNTTVEVWVARVKFELGNVATDWTPAPEDVQGQIDGLGTRVSSAETSIVQLSDQIQLKANQSTVDTLANRISSAESTLTIHTNQIASKVSQTTFESALSGKENTVYKQNTAPAHANGRLWLDTSKTPNVLYRSDGSAWIKVTPTLAGEVGAFSQADGNTLAGRLSTAESTIIQQAGLIASKAESSTVTALGTRVTTAEQNINGLTGEINQRVKTTDYNGNTIASLINQTATTIKLQASKIDLQGDVTIVNGKTVIGDLDAGKITTGYLNAARIAAKSIDVSKLNVSTLSAISADLGTITAGTIRGVEIEGASIKQVNDDGSIELSNNGLHLKDSIGNERVSLDTSNEAFQGFSPSSITFDKYSGAWKMMIGTGLHGLGDGFMGFPEDIDDRTLVIKNSGRSSRIVLETPEVELSGILTVGVGNFRIFANNIQSAVWWDNNVVCGWSYWQSAWWRFNWNTKSFEATNYAGTSFIPITASGWNTASKAEFKTDIKKWEESALEKIRNTTIYEYRLKEDESHTVRQGVVIGDGYQLDPSLIDKNETIDQYRMTSWSFKAIQELDSEQQGIKDRVAWLETENNYLKQKIKLLEEKIV